MNTLKYLSLLPWAATGLLYGMMPAFASPILGSNLAGFTVLGASTVTNVTTSAIVGNVGVWSSGGTNAITGFNSSPGVGVSDPQVTGGSVYAGGALAQSAQEQLTTAITNLGSLGVGTALGSDLNGLTLAPGVYTVSAGTTNLSGVLTLDGGNNANAAWVFQAPSTLITSPNSIVNLINTGPNAGIYWNVGSSATIDTDTTFLGNILALTSITMNTNATNFCGRALASNAAVTLDQNSLSNKCAGTVASGGDLNGGLDVNGTTVSFLPDVSIPEPTTLVLLAFGLLGFGFVQRYQR